MTKSDIGFGSIGKSVISGLLVIAIAALCGLLWNILKPEAISTGTIELPGNETELPYRARFSGTYELAKKDIELWLLIQPIKAGKFYPQYPKITKLPNKRWETAAYLGESDTENIGEEFIIYLVTADPIASEKIVSYIKESKMANSWDGMYELPLGANPIASITVSRK